MDPATGGILGIIAIVVSAGGAVIAAINHTRIRSSCCGKVAEASLDISQTTPPVKLGVV